ncbi:hypothetical protein ACFJIV_09615 [Mucilaginibacter sp. UC70_90]
MDFYLTALLQGLCFSAIALGIYISMKIFNIPDITTDGSYTLGGVVTAVLLTNHQPAYVILPAVILAGAAAGGAYRYYSYQIKDQCTAGRHPGHDGALLG